MKIIELKKLTDNAPDATLESLSYHKQALACVRAPMNPGNGMDIEEMRLSLRVIEKLLLAKDGDSVELEDADYNHFISKVRATRWVTASPLIVQFVNDVCNQVDVK